MTSKRAQEDANIKEEVFRAFEKPIARQSISSTPSPSFVAAIASVGQEPDVPSVLDDLASTGLKESLIVKLKLPNSIKRAISPGADSGRVGTESRVLRSAKGQKLDDTIFECTYKPNPIQNSYVC